MEEAAAHDGTAEETPPSQQQQQPQLLLLPPPPPPPVLHPRHAHAFPPAMLAAAAAAAAAWEGTHAAGVPFSYARFFFQPQPGSGDGGDPARAQGMARAKEIVSNLQKEGRRTWIAP